MVKKPSIEQVAWIFEQLSKHLEEGGDFRHLIYDRMGFDTDAYATLLMAGGLEVCNALDWVASRNDIEIDTSDDESHSN